MVVSYIIYIQGALVTALFLLLAQLFKQRSLMAVEVGKIENKTKYKIAYISFLILSILPLAFISGFRWGVGTDYFYTYYPGFYGILAGEYRFTEVPFLWLNKAILFFTTDIVWLFLITSFVFNIFMILSIKRMSRNWFISGLMIVLGNFFFISMNNVRQSCALAILIFSFSLFCDKKYIWGVITCGLACCFHYTSVMMLPIFIFVSFKKVKKLLPYIVLILLIFSPWYIDIAKLILAGTKYAGYLDNLGSERPQYPSLILHFLILLFTYPIHQRISDQDNYGFGLQLMNYLAFLVALESMKFPNNETMSRACSMFSWAIIFLIPYILDLTKKKWFNILIVVLLMIGVCGSTWYITIYLGHHEVFPYRSIFF